MGVDVNLYAVGNVTDEQLAAAEKFMADRCDRDPYFPSILRRSKWEPDRIYFETMSRYYGPCYERGHWPTIHNAIVSLRAALPDCTVHYGGDTEDDCMEATDEHLSEIWQHYLGPHGFDYRKPRT